MEYLRADFRNTLSDRDAAWIELLARKSRHDAVRMIDSARSGHIGGSLSSMDIFALLWSCKDADDVVVVSHGHTAPGVYAVLGNIGCFDVEEAVAGLRRGTRFEGHPSSLRLPGVSWCSGSLGQGLSVGCGLALAKRLRKESGRVFVVMGDGEQGKGQLQEAREFANKFELENLVAIVDWNGLQASGPVDEVLPSDLRGKYYVSGWQIAEADGHDIRSMHAALRPVAGPLLILARTVMGKGIPAIENDFGYHGKVLGKDACAAALRRLALSDADMAAFRAVRKRMEKCAVPEPPKVDAGKRLAYRVGDRVDCRSAAGAALASVAAANPGVPMAVLDCDLAASVKTDAFAAARPGGFIQCGIAEHNAATVAAALAKAGVLGVFAGFAVFAIGETYSQNRMADLNAAPVKLLCTHAGLDVGEDGKTHQCIDYIGLLSNLHGFRVAIPADANQADAMVRWALAEPGAAAVVMGRSKLPVLADADGKPRFGEPYVFQYGDADWLRDGKDACIVTYGNMSGRAIAAAEKLAGRGSSVAVLNVGCPLRLDEAKVRQAAASGCVLVYEDHNERSGLGVSVGAFLAERGPRCRFAIRGVSRYGGSDAPDNLYREQGLDIDSIVVAIESLLASKKEMP